MIDSVGQSLTVSESDRLSGVNQASDAGEIDWCWKLGLARLRASLMTVYGNKISI